MGTILIDKLLHVVVKRKASELHLAAGQPPVLRIDGRMKRLKTKARSGRHRRSDEEHRTGTLAERTARRGQQRFWFRVWRSGPLPCFALQAEGIRGHGH